MRINLNHRASRLIKLCAFVPLCLCTCLIAGCLQELPPTLESSNDVKIFEHIYPIEALQIIKQYRNDPKFIILDIRTYEEFMEGHLSGAVNLDYYGANFGSRIERMDKSKVYLIYSQIGDLSRKTFQDMRDAGFNRVFNMTGGYLQWHKEDLQY